MTEKEKAIREIQQALRNIEKSLSDAPSFIPDGIYSAETRKAVENFQLRNEFEVTGVVDYETWEAIINESRRIDNIRAMPIQVAPITNESLPLTEGSRSEFILTAKMMLNRVADSFGNFNRLTVDDFFDVATKEEVKRWQSVASIEENGTVDRETWDSLASFYLIK